MQHYYDSASVKAFMTNLSNVRNFTILCEPKAGISEILAHAAGIVVDDGERCAPGCSCVNGGHTDSALARVNSLLFHRMKEETLAECKEKANGHEFILNLANSTDDMSELRIVDGAFVVVDVTKGLTTETKNALKAVVAQRIKPVLVINNIESALLLSKEELYQTFYRIIGECNFHLSAEYQFCPAKGNVVFASTIDKWAFNLAHIAEYKAQSIGVEKEKLVGLLWGDNFYNSTTKQWSTGLCSKGFQRCFCAIVLDAVYELYKPRSAQFTTMLEDYKGPSGIVSRKKEAKAEDKVKDYSRNYFHLANNLLEVVCIHFPSPITAQHNRGELMNDLFATAIYGSEPEVPLLIGLAKMPAISNDGTVYVLARVLSGTVEAGMKVRIRDSRHQNEIEREIKKLAVLSCGYVDEFDYIPCGNIFALVGLE